MKGAVLRVSTDVWIDCHAAETCWNVGEVKGALCSLFRDKKGGVYIFWFHA